MKNSISARSPLSPTLWPSDAFRWWVSLGTVALIGLATLVPTAIVLAALIRSGAVSGIDPVHPTLTWPLLITQFASYVVPIALLLWLLPRIARRSLDALGLRAPRLPDLAWGIAGALAMFLVASAIGWLQDVTWHVKPDEVQVQLLRNARGSLVGGFVLLACFAAPFFEEIVFRGFIFNALLRYLPSALAILGSAILFGFAHWQAGNAGAIAPLAGAGLVLAAVYYRSGSLVASMFTHGLFNLVTVVAVVVLHQKV